MKRKLWIILALAALIAVLSCGAALADQSGTLSSTISWALTDDGTLTITGSGAIPDYSPRSNPSPFKSTMNIRSVVIGSGINRIGNDTFVACRSTLKSVSLPASLGSIGTEAFLECSGLTAVTLPEGLTRIGRYAFGETGLTSVIIPSSVTEIGEYSFYACPSLTEAYVLNSSAAFGEQAFGSLSDDFVLYGPASSSAQTYAALNSLSFLQAAIGTCGPNVTYIFTSANYTLVFCGTGPMTEFASAFSVPWYSFRSDIHSVRIGNGVTSISPYAFYLCTSLDNVTIPDSVARIGDYAFDNCGMLPSVTIPDSVKSIGHDAFSSCTNLVSVTMPRGLTSIAERVFYQCGSLTDVTIPDGVTSIGREAFNQCFNLTDITIPDGVTSIGEMAFFDTGLTGNLVIPHSVTSIGRKAFQSCGNLTGVRLPFHLNSIEDNTFGGCSSLTSILIPPSVTRIGAYAFSACQSATSVTMMGGVTSIGMGAFQGCRSLNSITIPSSVTEIGTSAFYNCSGLSSVTIMNPDCAIADSYTLMFASPSLVLYGWSGSTTETYARNENISFVPLENPAGSCGDSLSWSFDPATGTLSISGTGPLPDFADFGDGAAPWHPYCSSIASVRIGSGVTRIGRAAFAHCYGLKDVTIPGSVTGIGEFAFNACYSLKSLTIPNSVTSIRAGAFNGSGLISLILPGSVDTIDTWAFHNCLDLKEVTVLNPDCVIGDRDLDVFEGCNTPVLRGWSGSTAEAYAAHPNSNVTFQSLGSPAGSCGDGLTWSFDPATGTLTISGTGPMADFTGGAFAPWFIYRDAILSVQIGSGVTTIGDGAFSFCTGLSDITIPDSVQRIESYAFEGCASLSGITIPGSVSSIGPRAFSGCTGLSGLNIPDSVTSIGVGAFDGCTGLTDVLIPAGVTSIGAYAFSNCTGLTSITILNSGCVIGDSNYNVFPTGTSLVLYGLSGSTAQVYAYTAGIPFVPVGSIGGSKVTWFFDPGTGTLTIGGEGAMPDFAGETDAPWYSYHESISSVQIGSGVTGIGNYAFSHCTSLNVVIVPASVTTIGSYAFLDCTSLTGVAILNPDCVIGPDGANVFQGCTTGFSLGGWAGSTAEAYAASASPRCEFMLIAPAPDFFLPAGLTVIEADAFNGIAAQAVLIPRSIQSISGNPFQDSSVQYIYGFPGTAAEALAQSDPVRFLFLPLTDAWYARLTN